MTAFPTALALTAAASLSLTVVTASNSVSSLVSNPSNFKIPPSLKEEQDQIPVVPPRYPKDPLKTARLSSPVSQKGVEVRIIEGDIVTDAQAYPFFAQLENCGASLIHEDILLCAAHCENTWNPQVPAWIGGIEAYSGIYRTVTRQVTHPLWVPYDNTVDYDFMLMKLDSSALVDPTTGEKTGAETVPYNTDSNVPQVDSTLTAIGYGLIDEIDYIPSDVLREVDVTLLSDNVCFDLFGVDMFVPDIMMCTDGNGGGSCFGDSGGPLLTQDGIQVGIVSFGNGGCDKTKEDGVYARISGVDEWITEQICILSDNPPEGCETIATPPPVGDGPGAFTIHIKTDAFGYETAFNLKNAVTGEVLWDIPFFSLDSDALFSAPNVNVPVGNYTLEVYDAGYDGLCCNYGQGFFVVTDDNTGEDVYTNPGHFFDYVQVKLYVNPDGTTTFVSGSYYPPFEPPSGGNNVPNYPQEVDEEWPGPKPVARGSVFVNVKFDRYPHEVSWELANYNTDTEEWDSILTFEGDEDGIHNDMVSTQFPNLDAGWYRVRFEDSGEDGICCAYRRGWITVTGFLLATRRSSVVWGNNGEFGSSIEAYFELNANGFVTDLSLDEPVIS